MSPDRVPFAVVLQAVVAIAKTRGVDVLLVGATARDIALAADGHEPALRATNDVDIAVAVADSAAFEAFVVGLVLVDRRNPHKFLIEGAEVDIVSVGGIERPDRTIEWPDGTTMNTMGFTEALHSASSQRLPDGSVMAVASIPALAALKVFAWADRGHSTDRDAGDLRALRYAYSDGARLDGIYADGRLALLAAYDFEPRFVGAHWLGTEIQRQMGSLVAARCRAILDADLKSQQRLPPAVMRGNVSENIELVEALLQGLGS